MAKAKRRDKSRVVLRTGESQRADGTYHYCWTGRSDIAAITKDSVTAAGNLITKLKNADLIEPVSGFGKGKYKFIAPKE